MYGIAIPCHIIEKQLLAGELRFLLAIPGCLISELYWNLND